MQEEPLAQIVFRLLLAAGKTVTSAESCTGGLIAKLLTDIPGSSAVFPGSLVTYCDEKKAALLGVPEALLAEKGAVSPEVAVAMAEGARRVMGTDFALSTTGIAGPDSDGSGKPVGLIYLALADETGIDCRQLQLSGSRAENRAEAARCALNLLCARLTGEDSCIG